MGCEVGTGETQRREGRGALREGGTRRRIGMRSRWEQAGHGAAWWEHHSDAAVDSHATRVSNVGALLSHRVLVLVGPYKDGCQGVGHEGLEEVIHTRQASDVHGLGGGGQREIELGQRKGCEQRQKSACGRVRELL